MRKKLLLGLMFLVGTTAVSLGDSNPPPPSEFQKQVNQTPVINNQAGSVLNGGVSAGEQAAKEDYYETLHKEAELIREKEKNPSKYLQVLQQQGQVLVTSVVNAVENAVINQAAHQAAQVINQQLQNVFGQTIGGFLAQYTESLLLGQTTPEGVLKKGINKITEWLADKVEGLGFPPKFKVGLKKDITVGNKKLPGYNKTDAQVNGLDAVLADSPDPFVAYSCMNGKNDPICKLLDQLDTEEFAGVCSYSSVNQPFKEIQKDLSQTVEVAVSGSTPEALEPGGEQIEKKRVSLMTRAVVDSASYPPVGERALRQIPQPLRFKYAKVASDGMFRDTYLKSLQKRLITHYATLIALHKEIEAFCSIPQKPVLENCSVGGGLVGSVVSAVAGAAGGGGVGQVLHQVSSLNPSQVVQSISNLSSTSSILQSLQKQSQAFLKQLQSQKAQIQNLTSKLKDSFQVEGRGACCGVCWKALAQARANAGLIKSGTAAIVSTVNTAADKIVQALSVQECMTRNAIRTESAQTRAILLTAQCLNLHLEEEKLLLQIDSLETQVAQTGALMTMLQNAEFKKLYEEYKRIVEQGLEYQGVKAGS